MDSLIRKAFKETNKQTPEIQRTHVSAFQTIIELLGHFSGLTRSMAKIKPYLKFSKNIIRWLKVTKTNC